MSSINPPLWLGALGRLRATLEGYTIDEMVCDARDVGAEEAATGRAFLGIPVTVYLDAITQEIEKRIKNAAAKESDE